MKEWHPTKNGDLRPDQVTKGLSLKVWWQCQQGHEWQTSILTRSHGSQCPYCQGKRVWVGFNDLATTHPQLAAEWHPTKNEELTPQQVSYGMGRSVWWQCACGCEWQARLLARHQGSGCPACRDRRRTQKTKKKF